MLEFTTRELVGQGIFVGAAVLLSGLLPAAVFPVIATLANLGRLGLALAAGAMPDRRAR